jgi:hypothetical protein
MSPSSIADSVTFVRQPSVRTWYRAHNAIIARAYLDNLEPAKTELRVERFFINLVVITLCPTAIRLCLARRYVAVLGLCVRATLFRLLRQFADASRMIHEMSQRVVSLRRCKRVRT